MLDVTVEPKPLLDALRLVGGAADAETVEWEDTRKDGGRQDKRGKRKRVRVEAAADRLTLSAFDPEIGLIAVSLGRPAAVVHAPGLTAVDLDRTVYAVKEARGTEIAHLRPAPAGKTGVDFRVGPAKYAFDLPSADLSVPPPAPDWPAARVYATPLADALARAARQTGKYDPNASGRFDLSRVAVEIAGGRLVVTGTDGASMASTAVDAPGGEDGVCLVPARAAQVVGLALRAANAQGEVWVSRDALSVRAGGIVVAAAALAGRPFPVQKPPEGVYVGVGSADLASALRVTAATGGDAVDWKWDSTLLTLTARAAETGFGETVVRGASGDAPPADGRVSAARLLGLLAGLDGRPVELGLPAGGAAVVVRAGGFTGTLAQLGA